MGGSHITFYDLTSEVMQPHFYCVRFDRKKSRRSAHIPREENYAPPFAGRDGWVLQEHVEPEILLWPYLIITGLAVHAWGWNHLSVGTPFGTMAKSTSINQLLEECEGL